MYEVFTTKGTQHNSFGNDMQSLVLACFSVVFSGVSEGKVLGGRWGCPLSKPMQYRCHSDVFDSQSQGRKPHFSSGKNWQIHFTPSGSTLPSTLLARVKESP